MIPWEDIETHPDYESFDDNTKGRIRSDYFEENVATHDQFQGHDESTQTKMREDWMTGYDTSKSRVGNVAKQAGYDYAGALGKGLASTGQLLGRGIDAAGNVLPDFDGVEDNNVVDRFGQYVEGVYKGREEKFSEQQSTEFKSEQAKTFGSGEEGFWGSFTGGEAWKSPEKIAGGLVESAPSTILGMFTGGAVAKGMHKAGIVLKPWLKGLVISAAGEGSISAAQSSKSIYDELMSDKAKDQMRGMDEYIVAMEKYDDDHLARKEVAGNVARKYGLATGAMTSLTGIVSGKFLDDIVGKKFEGTVTRAMFKGGAIEAPEEAIQSGFEQVIQNIASGKYVDPSIKWYNELGETMPMGFVTGGAIGTSMVPFHYQKPGGQIEPVPEAVRQGIDDLINNKTPVAQQMQQNRFSQEGTIHQGEDPALAFAGKQTGLAEAQSVTNTFSQRIIAGVGGLKGRTERETLDAVQTEFGPLTRTAVEYDLTPTLVGESGVIGQVQSSPPPRTSEQVMGDFIQSETDQAARLAVNEDQKFADRNQAPLMIPETTMPTHGVLVDQNTDNNVSDRNSNKLDTIDPITRAENKKKAGKLVREDPVYKAMAQIKLQGGLNKANLRRDYDEDVVKHITKKYPGLVRENGTVNLDEIATELDFSDGEILYKAMADAKTIKEATADATQQLDDEYLLGVEGSTLQVNRETADNVIGVINSASTYEDLDNLRAELQEMSTRIPEMQGFVREFNKELKRKAQDLGIANEFFEIQAKETQELNKQEDERVNKNVEQKAQTAEVETQAEREQAVTKSRRVQKLDTVPAGKPKSFPDLKAYANERELDIRYSKLEKDRGDNKDGTTIINNNEGRAYILEDLATAVYKAGMKFKEFATKIRSVIGKKYSEIRPKLKSLFNELSKPLSNEIGTIGDYDVISADTQTDTKAFKNWSKNAEMIEGTDISDAKDGTPYVYDVYHATTHEFNVFDPTVSGNKEGAFGAVSYFTSSESDAETNYQDDGPDLTQRIERLAEQIEDGYVPDGVDIDPDEAQVAEGNSVASEQLAREALAGETPHTKNVYVRLDNPAYINGETTTYIENDISDGYRDDAIEEVKSEHGATNYQIENGEFDDQIGEYIYEQTMYEETPIQEAINKALDDVGYDHNSGDYDGSEIAYEAEPTATDLYEELKSSMQYIEDPVTGDLVSSHVVAQVFKHLGYDGIVLQNANKMFSNMGMEPNTSHIQVFEETPSQIKSATENIGTFDPADPDIRKSKTTKQPTKPQRTKLTTKQATAEARKFLGPKALKNWIDTGTLKIVDTEAELEGDMGTLVKIASQDGSTIAGYFNPADGSITIIAGNNPNGGIKYLLSHEGGHLLLATDKKFMQDKSKLLERFDDISTYTGKNKGKLRDKKAAQSAFDKARRAEQNGSKELIQEEALMYFLQDRKNQEIPLYRKIVAKIRSALRRLGYNMGDMTNDDLVELFVSGIKQNAKGQNRIVESTGNGSDILKSGEKETQWYSRLQERVKGLDVKKQPATAWVNTFNSWKKKKLPPALQEELEWSGVMEVLEGMGKQKVTKNEVLNMLESGGVKVDVKHISESTGPFFVDLTDGTTKEFDSLQKAEDLIKEELDWINNESAILDEEDDYVNVSDSENNLLFTANLEDGVWTGSTNPEITPEENWEKFYDKDYVLAAAESVQAEQIEYWMSESPFEDNVRSDDETSGYASNTLTGGKNYQEILISLPTDTGRRAELAAIDRDRPLTDTEQSEYDLLQKETKGEQAYTPTHFQDTPNLLVHIRVDERTDSEGNRVLFINEIQSDHSKDAREKLVKRGNLPELVKTFDSATKEYRRLKAKYKLTREQRQQHKDIYSVFGEEAGDEFYGADTALQKANYAITEEKGKVPNAPFIKSDTAWSMLGMKKAIKYAADNGFQKVAWPSTPEQVYEIEQWGEVIREKQNGQIRYKNQDGTGDVTAIVNRYMKALPRDTDRFLKSQIGSDVRVNHNDTLSDGQEVKSIDITSISKGISEKGVPLFAKGRSPQFTQWFGDSKITDENGEPMKMYHGSAEMFTGDDPANYTFDKMRLGTNTEHTSSGLGFFFTPSRPLAKKYADDGQIAEVNLSMQNPYKMTIKESQSFDNVGEAIKRRAELMRKGHDGIIIQTGDPKTDYYITFESNQSKSTDNKTYGDTGDIRFSKFSKEPATPKAAVDEHVAITGTENMNASYGDYASNSLVETGRQEIRLIFNDMKAALGTKSAAMKYSDKSLAKTQSMLNKAMGILGDTHKSIAEKEKFIATLGRKLPKEIRSELLVPLSKIARFKQDKTIKKRTIEAIQDAKRVLAKHYVKVISQKIEKSIQAPKLGKNRIRKGRGAKFENELKHLRDIINVDVATAEKMLVTAFEDIKTAQNNLNEAKNDKEAQKFELELVEKQDEAHHIEALASLKNKNFDDVVSARNYIEFILNEGRSKFKANREAYLESNRADALMVRQEVTGQDNPQLERQGERIRRRDKQRGSFMHSVYAKVGFMSNGIQSFETMLDKVTAKSGLGPLASKTIEKFGSLAHAATQDKAVMLMDSHDKVRSKAKEIWGSDVDTAFTKASESQDGFIHTYDEKGNVTDTIPMSEMEAAYWYLIARRRSDNDSIQKTFDKSGITDQTLNDIEKFMSPEVQEWADWIMDDFLDNFYTGINDVYSELNGIDLSRGANYIPMAREVARKNETEEPGFLGKTQQQGGLQNGSLKETVSNTNPFKVMDLNAILMNHIEDMTHYKAWAIPSIKMNAVLDSPTVRATVEQHHGDDAVRTISKFLEDFVASDRDKFDKIPGMDKIRANVTIAMVGLNPVVVAKQLTSIPAMAADIPLKDWGTGTVKAMLNIRGSWKFLMENSPLLKDRGMNGYDKEMQNLTAKDASKAVTGKKKLRELSMIGVQFGDKAAIVAGGKAVYDYYYKQAIKSKKTEDEAKKIGIAKFEQAFDRSQQSSNTMSRGHFLRGGSIQNMFTMFMTAPASYSRMLEVGIRGMVNSKTLEGKAKGFKITMIYGVVLPMVFQAVADALLGIDGDDEDKEAFLHNQYRAVAMSYMNGLPLIRDMQNMVVNVMEGNGWYRDQFSPVASMAYEGKDALSNFLKYISGGTSRISKEEYQKRFLENLAHTLGYGFGLPTKPASRVAKGVIDVTEGQVRGEANKARALLGYSRKKRGYTPDKFDSKLKAILDISKEYGKTKDVTRRREIRNSKEFKLRSLARKAKLRVARKKKQIERLKKQGRAYKKQELALGRIMENFLSKTGE